MISILHTADWQIGRVFTQFEPDDAAALFEARFAVVERLAGIATDRGVDAILVAGDVFDAQTVADKTIRRLFNAMQGFTRTWVLMPGNHDAALAESVWSRARRLGVIPGNVTVCLESKALVVAGKFSLLPAPLTQRHTYVDVTDWFAAHVSTDDLPRIGLAHGSVQGILPEDVDSANPIAAGRAQGGGLIEFRTGYKAARIMPGMPMKPIGSSGSRIPCTFLSAEGHVRSTTRGLMCVGVSSPWTLIVCFVSPRTSNWRQRNTPRRRGCHSLAVGTSTRCTDKLSGRMLSRTSEHFFLSRPDLQEQQREGSYEGAQRIFSDRCRSDSRASGKRPCR